MSNISYAITVCNEEEEFKTLIGTLIPVLQGDDEIVVLVDKPKVSEDFYRYLYELGLKKHVHVICSEFKRDFAEWKNKLNTYCTGDWIFQIDADEIPSLDLLRDLHKILEINTQTELIYVPRINIVNGLTQEDVEQWHWKVNENGWINWPDYQGRIYKNENTRIKWSCTVHEKVVGVKYCSVIPDTWSCPHYYLTHEKTIERQRKQNALYDELQK